MDLWVESGPGGKRATNRYRQGEMIKTTASRIILVGFIVKESVLCSESTQKSQLITDTNKFHSGQDRQNEHSCADQNIQRIIERISQTGKKFDVGGDDNQPGRIRKTYFVARSHKRLIRVQEPNNLILVRQ